jgi:hypothetical protein
LGETVGLSGELRGDLGGLWKLLLDEPVLFGPLSRTGHVFLFHRCHDLRGWRHR